VLLGVAWYSDVVHEVKPVTSGYRLALIYNLVNLVQPSSRPITTAATKTDSESNLQTVLSEWSAVCNREHPEIPRMLAYKLSYQYSVSSLSFASLKGSDFVKFRQLDKVCKDEDFLLYLAHIKKEASGACADINGWGYDTNGHQRPMSKATAKEKIDLGSCHEITEIHCRSLQLTRVLDQNCTEVAKYIDFAIEDIAQGNFLRAGAG
jgi:hypothetical protein